jgi:hypothetical protein
LQDKASDKEKGRWMHDPGGHFSVCPGRGERIRTSGLYVPND